MSSATRWRSVSGIQIAPPMTHTAPCKALKKTKVLLKYFCALKELLIYLFILSGLKK